MRLISANGIVAIAHLQVAPWRITLRRYRGNAKTGVIAFVCRVTPLGFGLTLRIVSFKGPR
jgi:hypothetical protein